MRWNKSKELLISLGLLLFVACFFLVKTNFAASDLGRHIKNGEIILATGKVLSTNLYSYVHTEFPAPNHHWLFGVISYLIHQLFGFSGLTLMSASLYTGAIALVYLYTKKQTGAGPSCIATLAALPVLADRSETRPEAFSLFFYALLLWLILRYLDKKPLKLGVFLISLFVIMAAWVNTHIFFILAFPLLGAAFLSTVVQKNREKMRGIVLAGITSLAACFINPFGVALVIYPFQIFQNYGYRVSENQSLWFFLEHFTRPPHWYLLTFIILSGLFLGWYLLKQWRSSLFLGLIFIFFTAFTTKLIRMENVLALTTIPLAGQAIAYFWKRYGQQLKKWSKAPLILMIASITGFAAVTTLLATGLLFPFTGLFGVGLFPGYEKTLTVLKTLPLQGPIFNNFDSGSALIYALYPKQQVFIDNRAEAYPSSFIQEEYISAQENEAAWQQLQQKYGFNTIIFYWHDQTNWGQDFLVRITQDPDWIPIYVDDYLLVLVKDVPLNQELIKQYQIPREFFTTQ